MVYAGRKTIMVLHYIFYDTTTTWQRHTVIDVRTLAYRSEEVLTLEARAEEPYSFNSLNSLLLILLGHRCTERARNY